MRVAGEEAVAGGVEVEPELPDDAAGAAPVVEDICEMVSVAEEQSATVAS